MSDSDEEDFQFYGTPIENEEETRLGQHRKEVRDAAATRALPLHQQVGRSSPWHGNLGDFAGVLDACDRKSLLPTCRR